MSSTFTAAASPRRSPAKAHSPMKGRNRTSAAATIFPMSADLRRRARVIAGGRDVRRWARDRARKLAAQRRQRETEKPTGGS